MNMEQLEQINTGKGFIAALDESGGSTPKRLLEYGITADMYKNDEEMLAAVHQMRTRIIKSTAFSSKYILAAILFENTMDRMIDEYYTTDFLWEQKGIVPILKVDQGLAETECGVRLMKPMKDLDSLLKRAKERHIFGTKMRSVIMDANQEGITKIVQQQFDFAKQIFEAGFVPIIEPEVDIHSPQKQEIETILLDEIRKHLAKLSEHDKVIFKLTIPTVDNFYQDLSSFPQTVRVVALSGGYDRDTANEKLAHNHGMIASFSRALMQGLGVNQSEIEFDSTLAHSIEAIYAASL